MNNEPSAPSNSYENGQMKSEGIIRDGKREGFWIYWDKEGHIKGTKNHRA